MNTLGFLFSPNTLFCFEISWAVDNCILTRNQTCSDSIPTFDQQIGDKYIQNQYFCNDELLLWLSSDF